MTSHEISQDYIDAAKRIDALLEAAESLTADLTEFLSERRLTFNEFHLLKDSAALALDGLDNFRKLRVKYVHGFLLTFAWEGFGSEDEKVKNAFNLLSASEEVSKIE